MNVIWVTSDTFRRDHIGAYGNKRIQTPSLDMLAAKSVRFQRHYAAFRNMASRVSKTFLLSIYASNVMS
jgi:arylsulfatase A-like enzyme